MENRKRDTEILKNMVGD